MRRSSYIVETEVSCVRRWWIWANEDENPWDTWEDPERRILLSEKFDDETVMAVGRVKICGKRYTTSELPPWA